MLKPPALNQPYLIDKSIRLRGSQYFSRTIGTPTNANTFTLSFWIKKTAGSLEQCILAAFDGVTNSHFEFSTTDALRFFRAGSPYGTSTALFRDTNAWYHVVISVANSVASIYVNNTLVSGPVAITVSPINNASYTQYLGRYGQSSTLYLNGYLAEVIFVDGQALYPNSFGKLTNLNAWVPIKYQGTYGSNGYYLNFSDNSSVTALGYDAAGLTNLYTYSQLFDNAAWLTQVAPHNVTATAEGVVNDPVGTLTAFKLTAGSSGYTVLYRYVTSTANTRHTVSFYLKAGTGSTANLTLGDPSLYNAISTQINLTTGATTAASHTGNASGGYVKSVDAGNGWWRVIVSGIVDSTSTDIRTDLWVPLSSDIYAWGAQLQIGDVKEYVPTVATARTTPNHWTSNGMTSSLTAGVDYDWMLDTPTNNFCTFNTLNTGTTVASSGNLYQNLSTTTGASNTGTMVLFTGSWFWEITMTAVTNNALAVGVRQGNLPGVTACTNNPSGVYYNCNGQQIIDGIYNTYGTAWSTTGPYILGVELNLTNNTVKFYLDGVVQPSLTLPANSYGWTPHVGFISASGSANVYMNFGQAPLSSGATYYPSAGGYFKYAPPAGAKALCTRNL